MWFTNEPPDEKDHPVVVGLFHNESVFPSGTGSNECPVGVPGVVFGGENVGVPADEEGDCVATPFYPRGIDPGTLCVVNIMLQARSKSLFKGLPTYLMKIKGNPYDRIIFLSFQLSGLLYLHSEKHNQQSSC